MKRRAVQLSIMSHQGYLLLGKDVVSLIHKFVHQSHVQELNREYCENLMCVKENGTVYFRQHRKTLSQLSTPYNSFLWNYRVAVTEKTNGIYNWKTAGSGRSFASSLNKNH